MKHLLTAVRSRLQMTAVRGMKVADIMPENDYKSVEVLCESLIELSPTPELKRSAESVLQLKYPTPTAMHHDVSLILNYFGGGCYQQMGKPILDRLDDRLKEHAEAF
jgi:hypothetical protein